MVCQLKQRYLTAKVGIDLVETNIIYHESIACDNCRMSVKVISVVYQENSLHKYLATVTIEDSNE